MACGSEWLLNCLAVLLFFLKFQSSQSHQSRENGMRTAVFLSPKVELEPGSVANKFLYDIDFPRGHIAVKSFDAEVVDEQGNPIPLHETYLHHWIVVSYYGRKGDTDTGLLQSENVVIRNSGMCDERLVQYFGLGAETRRTSTDVPDPYGIEVGNPENVPDGYEERWELNLHTIDTRGADDKLGCAECRCDLYNLTADQRLALSPGYNGGLECCYDGAKCRVKEGFQGVRRSIYLRYTVTYTDWDVLIIPVQIYILDVTEIWTKADESRGLRDRHHCLIEYEVEASNDGCIHTKSLNISLPRGGDVIYGVGHQHVGGIGSTLYGEGGRVICSSVPTYGTGDEPGNEAGYVVGMSTCYPSPGSVKISAGETLTLVSNYSSAQRHTGVMGLFYLLIADSSVKPNVILHSPAEIRCIAGIIASNLRWSIAVAALGVGVLVIIYKGKNGRAEGYDVV